MGSSAISLCSRKRDRLSVVCTEVLDLITGYLDKYSLCHLALASPIFGASCARQLRICFLAPPRSRQVRRVVSTALDLPLLARRVSILGSVGLLWRLGRSQAISSRDLAKALAVFVQIHPLCKELVFVSTPSGTYLWSLEPLQLFRRVCALSTNSGPIVWYCQVSCLHAEAEKNAAM
jgi:hypothetical protein